MSPKFPLPPQDDLQKLLEPLQAADPDEFKDQLAGLEGPSLDDTLQWELDGLPSWWPKVNRSGDEDLRNWSPSQRRAVLLRNLRDELPSTFPASPKTSSEKQTLVDTLRHIHGGLAYAASDILSWS